MSGSLDMRRLGAVALAALCLFALPLWAAVSLAGMRAAAAHVAGQTALLVELDRRLAALGEDAAASSTAAETRFAGETAALAGAEFQRHVAAAIETAGGEIGEMQARPADEAAENGERIELRVSFGAGTAGLQRALFAIETGLPLVVVRGLAVRGQDVGAADMPGDPRLAATLLLVAEWRAPR